MPACKVGCCPGDICDCSNDCECLLSSDADFSENVVFENPLLIAAQNLKGIPVDSSHKICPCRTKEELAEYVKPIEPRIHGDETENTPVKTNEGKKEDTKKDGCWKNGVYQESPSKSTESGTHAPLGHTEHSKDKCCDDESSTKTAAEKGRENVEGKLKESCCAGESGQKKGSHPPEHTKTQHHTATKSYSQDKSCGGKSSKGEQAENKSIAASCCDDKSSGVNVSTEGSNKPCKSTTEKCCDDESCVVKPPGNETHKPSKSTGGKFCDNKSCEVKPPGKEAHKHPKLNGEKCCDDKSCEVNPPWEETHKHPKPTGQKCCTDKSCEVKPPRQETHKHPKSTGGKYSDDNSCGVKETPKHSKPTGGSRCDGKKIRVEEPNKEISKSSSGGTCCENDTCGFPRNETHKHSHTWGSCCESKRGVGMTLIEETHKPCSDDESCKKNCEKKGLLRQSSFPSKPTSNPNSPSKIGKVPSFEIRPNFAFDQSLPVYPVPYRKMKRSQSLAEARLGSLVNDRRPSCFQLQMSSSSLRGGSLPDPHHGHHHHHIHEYHHAKYGYHSHAEHHHHHHDSDHQEDDSQHNDCCSGNLSLKVDTSCCEDPNCGGDDQCQKSPEELEPLMKADVAKVDMDEMILQTTKLRVQNMCCPKEAQIVQDELRKFEGIENIRVNVIGRVAHVSHFPELVSPTTIMNILNKRHLGVSIVDTGSEAEMENGLPRPLKISLANLAVQAVLVAVALAGTFTSSPWYMWVAIVEICFGIFPVLKKVYRAIRNKEVDLNILITITVIGTLAIQEWVEGAAVVFVFTLAGFLQRYCFHRVQKTISSLMLSKPSKAVMACTGECIPIEDVPIGSIIAVRQGELIPLDGIVVKGVASVDESSISGEATPVEKILESPAYSGTVIQNGYLEIETTSSSTSSTISKISAMVEDAQMNVSPTEIMVNKFAKFYTPLVIVVSALVFLIPLFIGLGGVEAYEGEAKTWGVRALIVLVTACPCALLMATPTVVICGINGAARLGALIKGGTYLEALGQLNILAFDKTGTLTEGKFQVVDLVPADDVDESDSLRWAAALESKSSHPLAAAVVSEFTGECVSDFADSDILPEVSEFCTMEGQGISGKVEGHDIQVGNRSLLEKLEVTLTPKFETAYISFCDDAKTVIFVCVDGKLALMISLADIIRWESRAALTWLQELGVHLCMLTGDAKQTANAVQKELQLDSCVSDMKPDDKLNWITNVKIQDERRRRFGCLRKKNQIVGMVGDGVNDGPALAASDVGIAMAAGGSALAVEAAGVALMNNSVLKVPEMICLSRFCRRIILQNIILSVLLKLVFVVVAFTGFVRVWMAVLADLVGLLVVILNGLRPLRWKPPRTKKKTEPPRASFRRKRPLLMYETVV